MIRRASLLCCVLLVILGCEEEEQTPNERGTQTGDDSLRSKLDAYLRQGALEESVDCMCDGLPEEECEDLDITSEQARDCYVEEARSEEAATAAFFDCATPIMKRYVDCMSALDSCEGEGAERCESDYAAMLSCPAPSRAVRDAWRMCDEQL